jgi:hypothetical protein
MRIKIKSFAFFRPIFQANEMEVDVGQGLKPFLVILINGRHTSNLNGLEMKLDDSDAVEVSELFADEQRVNTLWPIAMEQRRVTAANMKGVPATYGGSVARNIAGMGWADGPDGRVSSGSDVYHKIDMDRGALKGLIFIEKIQHEGLYKDILLQRIDVVPFTDAIPKRTFVYSLFQRRAMRI